MHGAIRIFQDSYWPAVIFRALQILFEAWNNICGFLMILCRAEFICINSLNPSNATVAVI